MQGRRNIGGWWRLWVLWLVVTAAVAGGFAFWRWPMLANIAHEPAFIERMSPAAQEILKRPPAKPFADLMEALRSADTAAAQEKARALAYSFFDRVHGPSLTALGNLGLRMPNGEVLEVPSDTGPVDSALVTREYTAVLQHELAHRRITLSLRVLAAWIVPALLICGFGLMIGWVQKGFAADRARTR